MRTNMENLQQVKLTRLFSYYIQGVRERASTIYSLKIYLTFYLLLPIIQYLKLRTFKQESEAIPEVLWGFFKKKQVSCCSSNVKTFSGFS